MSIGDQQLPRGDHLASGSISADKLGSHFDAMSISSLISDYNMKCKSLGHVVDMTEGNQPVVYLDGLIAGYCHECGDRILIPRIDGGMAVPWIKALGEKFLAGEFDEQLWSDFVAAEEAVEKDRKALDASIGLVKLLRKVVSSRFGKDA